MPNLISALSNKTDPLYALDNSKVEYHSVCPPSTGSGILADYKTAFSCPGSTEKEWYNMKQQYRNKFTRAKRCLQGRMDAMLDYGNSTRVEQAARSSHVFPIQAFYVLAKDCLKKFAPDATATDQFRQSVDAKLQSMIALKPKLAQAHAFKTNTMEGSIDNDELKIILKKQYYDPIQWDKLYKCRKSNSIKDCSDFSTANSNTLFALQNNYFKLRTRKNRRSKSRRNLK